MKKKSIIAILLTMVMCLGLAGCGDKAEVFEQGETIITTAVEIDVKSIDYASLVSLDAGDLYKGVHDPSINRGLVAGDSETYLILEMDIKNIATGNIYASDIFERMTIVYDDEYRYWYDHSAWLGSAIPMDGSYGIEPLVVEPYRVIFECSQEILNDGKPLHLQIELDNGNIYKYPLH